MGTVIAGVVVALVVGLAARSLYKTRKSGGCGCGCDGCPNSSVCHPNKK